MPKEYSEGTKVRNEFERTMSTWFRAPKPKKRKQAKMVYFAQDQEGRKD